MIRTLIPALLFAVQVSFAVASSVTFDFAPVRNAGNAADLKTGLGAVSYNYAISKTEVTNAQYTAFLNAVAATDSFAGPDPNLFNTDMGSTPWGGITRSGSSGSYTYAVKADAVGLGPGGTDYTYGDKPVVFTSFFDAMRFSNWLHNGQGDGDTETGAYTIGSGLDEVRAASAKYWIPSENEWYKAAYHNASAGTVAAYFGYATGTNSVPNNNLPVSDTGNSANFLDSRLMGNFLTTGSDTYPLTDVGSYGLSASPYGTFDQNGNVWEWNEAVIGSDDRILRGGSWRLGRLRLLFNSRLNLDPTAENNNVGFRVATVPEPSSLLMGAMAAVGLAGRYRRRETPPTVVV